MVEGETIETSGNTACEVMKQRGGGPENDELELSSAVMTEGGPIQNAAYEVMKQGGGQIDSAVMMEGGPIESAHNAAYEMMKQREGEPENDAG